MSRYKRGTAFERRIQHWLEGKGYLVIRSAGSHGIFDLIAISSSKIFGIQLKAYNENLYGKELDGFRKFKGPSIMDKLILIQDKDRDIIYLYKDVEHFYYEIQDL